MKVLQLCNKPPYPAKDGGCIAIKNISLGLLSNRVKLKILTMETEKHPFLKDEFPSDFIKRTKIESIFIDTKLNVIDAFSALVTSDSYNISRFFSSDFNSKLKSILINNEYDIVHLESLFLTPYIDTIRRNSKSKIILRSHNLEHLIWERLANLEKNKAKKIYLKHLAKKLKQYEKSVLNDVDAIATISSEDQNRYVELQCNVPIETISFALKINQYPPTYYDITKNKLKLFHIGSMDWMPNIEAINWFVNDIFPQLNNKDITLNIAGKNMPKHLLNLNLKNFKANKEVKSAIEYMSKFDVMIVPLLSGSGMRIKIIEAMALGKTVITTSVGLEGIDAKNGKEVLVADSEEMFISQINFLSQNPEKNRMISENARCFIEKHHNSEIINKHLLDLYNKAQ
ncbi:MAG TPA: glycosyltransferase [Crocinitomix sp.]|nr:glycosyltransferase [Crocinitomix sp.]